MKRTLFVDTNIIIEAHRTTCWSSLLARYEIHLVEEVFNEALNGRKLRDGYVHVDRETLIADTYVHAVTTMQLSTALAACAALVNLDKGERDLLAFVHSCSEDAWFLSTADRAAVKVAFTLGLRHRLLSLEEAAGTATIPLKSGYTKRVLDEICTECVLDSLT